MKNLIQETLNRYRDRVDYLEIRVEESKDLSFAYSNDHLLQLERTGDFGISIRACCRGGWGFTSLNAPEKLDEFASQAVEMARTFQREKTVQAEVVPCIDHITLDLLENPANIPLAEKLDLFKSYIDRARSLSDSITNTKASYMESFRTITFMNTNGTDLVQEKMDLGGILIAAANRDNLTQVGTVTNGSSNDFSVFRNWEGKIDRAGKIAVDLLDAQPVRAGKYPVILDPVLAGTFVHEAFGHMSEADDYDGNKRMQEIFTLNRRFGSDCLSIYDTGLDIGTRGFIRYDDEGVPAEKTDLIRNGILVGRLHSRESAGRLMEKPTGNARTINYRFPPICRMRNTCIEQGNTPFEDLIRDIPLGVYAVDTNGGTGGEMFSFDAAYGYMIRDGKLAERVRDLQLSGNLFTTLNNIDAVGDDFTITDDAGGCGKGAQFPLETTCSAPHIRITEATVGGS